MLINAQDADINIAASGIWLIQLQTVATSLDFDGVGNDCGGKGKVVR
jgi:hypothetical protein